MTDLEELGRRAIACKGWKWLPGMLFRENAVPGMGLWPEGAGRCGRPFSVDHVPYAATPDLTDPATLGCLLQLVREAWGDDRAYLCDFEGYDSVEWGVVSKIWDEKRNEEGPKAWFSCLLGDGKTEAEALVYALEKAP